VTDSTPRFDRELLNPRYHVDDGDILFSWSGSLVVKLWSEGKAVLNQHLFKVTPSQATETAFIYLSLKQAIPAFSALTTGATMQHIRKGELEIVSLLAPSRDVMKRFCQIASPMLDEVILLARSNRTLVKTRDLLLPRLISGKLSVEDLDIQLPPSMEDAA